MSKHTLIALFGPDAYTYATCACGDSHRLDERAHQQAEKGGRIERFKYFPRLDRVLIATEVNTRQLLLEVAAYPEAENLFTSWVDLLGSRIGWVEGELFRELCVRYGISEECEVVMVQISALTECHLHRVGASTFMVLGKRDVIIPKAEILLGDYSPGETDFSLVRLPAVGGKVFEIPAGKIHAFVASEPALTLIGVVNPRIRNGDEFDIVPFEYLSAQPYVVKLEDSK